MDVRFAEKNSWYISQMIELLQNYGDSMLPHWSQQLIDAIKYGQLISFHFSCLCIKLLHGSSFIDVDCSCLMS